MLFKWNKKIFASKMICHDFMVRVCCRNPCKMHHKVNYNNAFCNGEGGGGNKFCKLVDLTEYEICEVNENVRPFRQTIYNEMKRLAFLLRETFLIELKTQACTLYVLGECLWPCLTCRTPSSNSKFF